MATEDKSLHELFASLRSSSSARPQSASQQTVGTEPRQQSSPPIPDSAVDRTASLLSLLKFNQPSQQQQAQQPKQQQQSQQSPASHVHGRGVSASDLVASSMGKPASSTREQLGGSPITSSANPQDYLLQLLNRAQYGSESSPARSPQPIPQSPSLNSPSIKEQRKDSPIRVFGSAESREPTPFEPQMPSQPENTEKPLFSYVNPFEQLAASSPLNAPTPARSSTPQKPNTPSRHQLKTGEQEKIQITSKSKAPSLSRQTSGVRTEHIIQSIETSAPDQQSLPSGSRDSKTILGAPTTDTATVAEALNRVSEQVSRQADLALAQAERSSKRVKSQKNEELDLEQANKGRREGNEPSGLGVPKKSAKAGHTPVTAGLKPAMNEAPEGNVDGHGSADDEKSSANGDDEFIVPVYNFIMKPFVSIELTQKDPPTAIFREKTITDIARLKKEFDQIDRTLATASSEYIIYSLPKSGGIRVIRQEDGADRHVFKETRDHVFNVALSTASRGATSSELQTSIATATSGTVYWTALYHNEDHIESKNIEDYCLTFPPISAHEDHTSGGQLKTRAKRSSSHPEFFAIGRGKTLQIVFPLHAAGSPHTSKKNVVNTETYFKERSLKINTGKAGKDFTFSEDDTVIASLDKAGRMRFWDIRELVAPANNDPEAIDPVEILTPIITYSTAVPNEKSWPTSVLLVDKLRAYAKGTALRYAIVGMKQNHTLQLWDLGLGKAIQEVHFPHSKESDPICSVCYHSPSGIIVVAHPTRNSIYFIHLSAPKYNLSGISQANYMSMLAEKDESLPKPDSTAIMSGMREYSFASKGQLRSVDLLPVSGNEPTSKDQPALFELYVMHSKGVTMLSINREDLGWSEDMKVINPVSAQDAGLIRVSEIVQPPAAEASENSSVNGDNSSILKASTADSSRRSTMKSASKPPDDIEQRVSVNGAIKTKLERRKKKKAGTVAEDSSSGAPPATAKPILHAGVAGKPGASSHATATKEAPRSINDPPPKQTEDTSGANIADPSEDPEDPEGLSLYELWHGITVQMEELFSQQFSTLHTRLNTDRRALEDQHGANQEAMLLMVSKLVGENVEKSLKKVISETIQKEVVPTVKNTIISAVQKDVVNSLSKTISATVQEQMKRGLTDAATKAVKDADFVQANTQLISSAVSRHISKDMDTALTKTITLAINNANSDVVERVSASSSHLLSKHLAEASAQRQADAEKVDQLLLTVQNLSQLVGTMEATQRHLRDEISTLKSEQAEQAGDLAPPLQSPGHMNPPEIGNKDDFPPYGAELDQIAAMMRAGDYEDATVKWIQSSYQADIFDNYFVRIDPQYLRQCSPLVTLSLTVAVTASLQTNLHTRLRWLDLVFDHIDLEDSDIRDVAPKIMHVLCQRLETNRVQLSERTPSEPSLAHIPRLIRRARDIASQLS